MGIEMKKLLGLLGVFWLMVCAGGLGLSAGGLGLSAGVGTAPSLVVDIPQPRSVQSGIGLIHGWVCGGGSVTVGIDGQLLASVTADAPRWDVAQAFPECGPSSGFGIPMNWGNLRAGVHNLSVNGVEISFSVGGFGGFVGSTEVDFSTATIVSGFDDTFWFYGVKMNGRKYNLLYRWDSSIQGLSVISVEPVQDVPDPCGFSPPDPSCRK